MSKNNFKELEEQEMANVSFDDVGIQKNINSSMGLIRFVTDIVELYIPNVVETFLSTLSQNKPPKK